MAASRTESSREAFSCPVIGLTVTVERRFAIIPGQFGPISRHCTALSCSHLGQSPCPGSIAEEGCPLGA